MKRTIYKLGVTAVLSMTVCSMSVNAEQYVVQKDDCWSSIAEQFDVSTEDLLIANNDSCNTILQIGRTLDIPTKTLYNINTVNTTTNISNDNLYYPKENEGWYSISKNTGIAVKDLLRYNNATLDTLIILNKPIKLSDTKSVTTTTAINTNIVTTTVTTTKVDTTENKTLIGTKTLYNTPFGNSWFNITYMASKLNGVTVQPNETFSMYNYPAFPNHCNELDGFKESYAFDGDGNLIKSYGGGICFTSTAFYQCAVLECDLLPVERHNHVNKVGYAIQGEDAAINLDSDYVQDMKFKNIKNYPIQFIFDINNYTGALTVSAYKIS
jgi:vancomycin resistance protein YoaR